MEDNPYKAPGKFKHPPEMEDRELTRWLLCIFGALIGVVVLWVAALILGALML